jgi:acetaldehyde dehydrogenase (acetylating)
MYEGQSQLSVASSARHRQEAEVAATEECEQATTLIVATATRVARLAVVELVATMAEVEAAAWQM